MTEAWFPPGSELPRHVHDRAVVAVTLSGAIQSTISGRSILGRTGDVWTEPLGDPHANRIGPDGAHVLVIQPDPGRDDLFNACARLLEGVNHFRHQGIAHLARTMVPEIRRESDVATLMLEGIGLELLSQGAGDTRSIEPRAPWFGRVLDVVHDRFRERLSLEELAGEAGVHPAHFTRVFRRRTGVTVGAYTRRLRVQWAATRLASTEEPIGRIALQAGFADQSHLSREFRRQLDTSPGAYRAARRGSTPTRGPVGSA